MLLGLMESLWMHVSSGQYWYLHSQTREIIGNFLAKLPAQHGIEIRMSWLREVWLRGHFSCRRLLSAKFGVYHDQVSCPNPLYLRPISVCGGSTFFLPPALILSRNLPGFRSNERQWLALSVIRLQIFNLLIRGGPVR